MSKIENSNTVTLKYATAGVDRHGNVGALLTDDDDQQRIFRIGKVRYNSFEDNYWLLLFQNADGMRNIYHNLSDLFSDLVNAGIELTGTHPGEWHTVKRPNHDLPEVIAYIEVNGDTKLVESNNGQYHKLTGAMLEQDRKDHSIFPILKIE